MTPRCVPTTRQRICENTAIWAMSKYQNEQVPPSTSKDSKNGMDLNGVMAAFWGKGQVCHCVSSSLFAWSFQAECHFNAYPYPSAPQNVRFLCLAVCLHEENAIACVNWKFVFVQNRMDGKENLLKQISSCPVKVGYSFRQMGYLFGISSFIWVWFNYLSGTPPVFTNSILILYL